jgi:bifunctional non-homologous end joining protein LigD
MTVTHPDRLLFPAAGLTKLDMVRYYDAVAEVMLPHLVGRPLTLKQCAPDSEHCRYLRHSGERAPTGVRVVAIQEKTKVGDYMIADTHASLLALAQRNMVELHTWNATDDNLERPNRVVFDLDPGPRVAWPAVVEAARLVRTQLRALGLESWVKTTGGAGLHVVAPIEPRHDWSVCLEFARQIAASIAEHDPSRYTIRFAKLGRESQILVDYLRNNRTNTSVCAYSVRARPLATVSMPIDWEELGPRLRPDRWTIVTAPARVARSRDSWAAYGRARQRLPVQSAQAAAKAGRRR